MVLVDILRNILFELKDQNYLYRVLPVKNNHSKMPLEILFLMPLLTLRGYSSNSTPSLTLLTSFFLA